MQKCAANYRVGDRIVINDASIDLEKSINICLLCIKLVYALSYAPLKRIVRERLDERARNGNMSNTFNRQRT
jgi:hypothetical protein